ncbi:Reversal of tor2 lethality [Recurvomyces mirabilis]|uniref:Protein ROT1 n=1 Tax=Recurvomyces mirabilis TaxID=574656 RepID=A0AAE0WUX6_9PEZI|nr:Reversal of tor2 lethality [Recurvomyces mirabilis]
MLLYSSLAAAVALAGQAAADTWPTNLVGTWSTKSNQTLTGPGFYDPLNENLIEPSRTGISYSFTQDGYYEEAYYRAVSNPQNPSCPSGIMQWQHGSWVMNTTGSLILTPIAVDGRQLLSSPCQYKNSVYTRYNQSEVMASYAVYTDPYHNIPRLDLHKFDKAPMNPMYLVFSPPQMLPTTTLNPTTASATAGAKSTSKAKRSLDSEIPLSWKLKLDGKDAGVEEAGVVHHINADRLWWLGLGLTGVGGLLYLGPRRMGVSL